MLSGSPRLDRRTTNRAFTLIELLVVIAIIAILAAILFPVFAQAREKARQTTCLNNQKQIALGVMQYVQDFDETYPRLELKRKGTVSQYTPDRVDWNPYTWKEAIEPYVKNGYEKSTFGSVNGAVISTAKTGIWICPSEPWGDTWRTYGGNNMVFSKMANDETGDVEFDAVAQAKLSTPANTVMVSELGTGELWDNSGVDMTSDWWAHGGMQWPPQFEGANSGAKYDGDIPTGKESIYWPNAFFPRYRHSGVSNFAFADGHVKAMAKGRLNWCANVYVKGTPATWQGEDLSWMFDPNWDSPCRRFVGTN